MGVATSLNRRDKLRTESLLYTVRNQPTKHDAASRAVWQRKEQDRKKKAAGPSALDLSAAGNAGAGAGSGDGKDSTAAGAAKAGDDSTNILFDFGPSGLDELMSAGT